MPRTRTLQCGEPGCSVAYTGGPGAPRYCPEHNSLNPWAEAVTRDSLQATASGLDHLWRFDPKAALMATGSLDDFARQAGFRVILEWRGDEGCPIEEPSVRIEATDRDARREFLHRMRKFALGLHEKGAPDVAQGVMSIVEAMGG